MEITIPATSTEYYGTGYITSDKTLRLGQPEGDYAIARGVDFGKGKKGFKVLHNGTEFGVGLVEVRLDSLKGKSVGVCACGSHAWRWHDMIFNGVRLQNPAHVGETYEVWCEIEKTTGIHDVYLVFHEKAEYLRFGFTTESPYKEKAYTPVPKKYEREVFADTWEATDMLGRKIPSAEECPDKKEKIVGMFYWLGKGDTEHEAINVTKVLKDFPEAEYNVDHPVWHQGPKYWGEPLYGFYHSEDPYVLRKHILMLAAAGVDFIAFDNTNAAWPKKQALYALLEALRQAKLDGINVPKITFLLNLGPGDKGTEYQLRSLYQDIYKPGLYSDLWFMYEGKPLMIGYPSSLSKKGYNELDTEFLNEIRNFFTFRMGQGGYSCGPNPECKGKDWGWLERMPLHKYGERKDGTCEQMAVGVAQNCNQNRDTWFNNEGTFGRSYTMKDGHALLTEDSYKYGYNFQEQFDYAIEADPDIIFITGWNEWNMAFIPPSSPTGKLILPQGSNQIAFYDQFEREHSRDIEPDSDGYLDTYFLQLVGNVRKFKGTKKLEKASAPLKNGKDINWDKVTPKYMNMKGSAPRRDFPGCGKRLRYQADAGRNDIIEARVARDDENLYFYAKCADKVKDSKAENAMVLYLDLDRNKETGWEGYEFRAIGNELQKSDEFVYDWEKVGKITRKVSGETVVIIVPKKLLGLGENFDIEFKWSDNAFSGLIPQGEIMDFYVNGVTAPIGRFNFRYKTK